MEDALMFKNMVFYKNLIASSCPSYMEILKLLLAS
jgi:hypothetical protein